MRQGHIIYIQPSAQSDPCKSLSWVLGTAPSRGAMAMGADVSRGAAAPRVQALFVGRQPTLASLHRMLNQARAGEPRLVLIEGPAGIGKTTLVRRFLDEAGERRVLRASGEEAEAGLAFGVLTQLLAHVPTTPPGPAAGVVAGERPVDPLAAGAVLLDQLGELQRTDPVVVVVDDLHWADRPSLRALTFALRRLRVDRVLTLLLAREVAEAPLPDGLRRLLADDDTLQLRLAGLQVEQPATLTVGFPHPLVHAAIYQQLGPARRAGLHTRAAGLVDDEAARLRHRVRAASGPDPALAADLARAGRRHTTGGTWASAAEQLATAARLAPDRADQEQFTLEAVECQLLAGDLGDLAGVTARLRGFRDSGWRSYILARLALVAGRLAETEGLLRDAWQRCDPATDPALGARIAGQLAGLCTLQARGQDAADWADLALRLASEQTATDLIHYLPLVGRGISGHADAALAAVATLPDPAVASVAELDTLLGRGLLRTWTDDLAGARQDLAGVLAAAHDRSVAFRLLAAVMLGQAEYRLGCWDDAVVHCDLAVSIAADADQTWFGPFWHAMACLVRATRGQWGPATAHAEAAQLGAVPGYLAAIGYAATATAHLARARGQPEAVVAARSRHSAIAAAARARANLEAARGDHARADQAFQTGLAHASKVDLPFDRALLQLVYGAFLRRAGKRTPAAAQLRAARATLARLDARPDLARCERELAACGLRPGRRKERDTARLTPQELAVARLVVAGLSNQQAARELVVSVKTVEYHLGNVYAKLQVTSRGQLTKRLAKP